MLTTPPMKAEVSQRVVGLWDALRGTRYRFDACITETDDGEQRCITLGRSRDCTIQVNDTLASREHCVIEERNGRYVLRDQSRNGTRIDRRPVVGEVTLLPDMYIAIGGALFIVVGEDEHPELRAKTTSSFWRRAHPVYGSYRKAGDAVGKGHNTIRRAVEAKKEQNASD